MLKCSRRTGISIYWPAKLARNWSDMVASVRHFGFSRSSALAPGRAYFDDVTVFRYRRIPKVTAPVTLEYCRQKGPLLSGSRYLRAAVIFWQIKKVCNSKWSQTERARITVWNLKSFYLCIFLQCKVTKWTTVSRLSGTLYNTITKTVQYILTLH